MTENGNNKKMIENLVIFVIILIITIIAINVIWNDQGKDNTKLPADEDKVLAEAENDTSITSSDKLIENLENILSKIDGVGNVNVLITYSQTSQVMPVYNEDTSQKDIEEKDTRWTGQGKLWKQGLKRKLYMRKTMGGKV